MNAKTPEPSGQRAVQSVETGGRLLLALAGHGEPMSPAELEAYCGRLRDIVAAGGVIREVHAYTIARPTPEAAATRLSPGELEAVAATIRSRTGLAVSVYA